MTSTRSSSGSSKSKAASSFQSLGGGTYRVSGAIRRSAVTGRYVAMRSPGQTASQQRGAGAEGGKR